MEVLAVCTDTLLPQLDAVLSSGCVFVGIHKAGDKQWEKDCPMELDAVG